MYSDAKKIHLIEKLIATSDERTLNEVEIALEKSVGNSDIKRISAHEFAGLWSKEDAAEINKVIEDHCEQINPNDWK